MKSLNSTIGNLSPEKRANLAMLREARSIVHRNSESFRDAATLLEHVGQIEQGEIGNGLGSYKKEICKIGENAPEINKRGIQSLFETVLLARNDSVHSGDYIRHHSIKLVELLLILEEGIAMSAKTVGDLMVQNPTIAELWYNLASVRRLMLTNSFSFLPIQDGNGVWKVISDTTIVKYLREDSPSKTERNRRLGENIQDAIKNQKIELTNCKHVHPGKNIEDASKNLDHIPMLVIDKIEGKQRLLGILTSFDLL